MINRVVYVVFPSVTSSAQSLPKHRERSLIAVSNARSKSPLFSSLLPITDARIPDANQGGPEQEAVVEASRQQVSP